MAPRKRTTKQRKNDPKTAKLEAFLQDFDSEVETRVVRMKEKINQLLKDVENSFNMELIKLPKAVRQMTWLEHCSTLTHILSINGRTRKPPTTSKRAKALAVSKQNTSIRRSNRKQLVTPARSLLDSSLMMGATPLITPRFDPRLPKTPAVRVPRHKERVYSISVNGSPIAAGNEDIVINIPSGNGESVQLLASQIDSVDLSLLDETALKSIQLLQNRLTTLCGIAE
uniref:Uncharacterized protein n=1 Tax=Mola mola TaxID=94237 RepID=A0A3Q4BF61_MOLML